MAQTSKASHSTSRIFITDLLNSIPTPEEQSDQPLSHNVLQNISPETKNLLLTLHVLFPNEFLPALDLLDRSLLHRFTIRDNAPPETAPPPSAAVASPHPPLPPPPQDTNTMDTSDPIPLDTDPHLHTAPGNPPPAPPPPPPRQSLFFVRSAQAASSSRPGSSHSHSRFHDPLSTHYEVRTLAWNCSCPAFAFSAFPAGGREGDELRVGEEADDDDDDEEAATDDSSAEAQQGGGEQREQQGGEWVFGGVRRGRMVPPVCKHLLACVLVDRVQLFRGLVEDKVVSREELAGWCAGWGG